MFLLRFVSMNHVNIILSKVTAVYSKSLCSVLTIGEGQIIFALIFRFGLQLLI